MVQRLQYKDLDLLLTLLSTDDIFWTAKDDFVDKDSLKSYLTGLLLNPEAYILSPSEGVVFFFWKVNGITYEIHVAIEIDKRKQGFKGAAISADWIFSNTPCEKLITYIPSHHKPAIMFASMCGLVREGTIKEAFKYNDENLSLILMGATKIELYKIYKDSEVI